MGGRLVALGECSNEFVVREGSIKSARFVQGSERRKAERERVWKKSSTPPPLEPLLSKPPFEAPPQARGR